LKFTQKGHVEIRIDLIKNPYLGNEEKVKISIKDTGIGIKLEDQKKLFQPFGMLDNED